jgi:uncharacterized protein YgiB involved in biofilm formation
MTASDPKKLKSRPIRRKQIYLGLAVAAVAATGFVILSSESEQPLADDPDAPVKALFYQDTAQCEADIQRQQTAYNQWLRQGASGQMDPPPMQVADCAPQMQAARQVHDQTAPQYASQQDCQAEGVQCESVGTSGSSSGSRTTLVRYRPVYGGTYLHPYESAGYTSVNYQGTPHRVYPSYPVYQSTNSAAVVTPHGRTVPSTAAGPVTVPRHTAFTPPARPNGVAAQGTIRGRGSQGFGSTFKSTGSGGK